MRIHTAIATTCLIGTAALGGCADIPFTDDTFTLSNAASMRVEVEVYKGPLSKTLPVQWGELEGMVDTAVGLLEDFGGVICGRVIERNSKCGGGEEASKLCPLECKSASDAARSTPQCADPGEQILRGMYADARCLLEEATKLQSVVRRSQPGSPGCHINQALAALDEPTIGPCSVSRGRTVNKSANEAIDEAGVHLKAALGAAEKIRDAAGEVNKSVRTARMQTDDASNYVRRRTLINDANAAGNTLTEWSIDLADGLDGLRDAIADAGDYATQVEDPDSGASSLQDALAEIDGALREAKKFAETSKQPHVAQIGAFKKWWNALGNIDDSAAMFTPDEATGLSSLAESSASSLDSATRTVSEIASEVKSTQAESDEIRTRATAWRRRLVAAAIGLARDRATVADLRTQVAGIENKVDVLTVQLEKNRPSLDRALEELKAAQTTTKILSDATNEGIPDTPWEDAVREHVVRRVGDLGMKLKATAFYWAEIHTALAPCCRDVRIAMAGFTNLASELSNHLGSRADALQWQLDDQYGTDARYLPLSLYLRDAEPTDFLNLYTWNRAAAPALLPDMVWHPLNAFSSDETADRVRVIERLFADHNWGKINTVYGSGQGDFTMALVKDEIGNWSLKSFEADPTKLVKAFTDLTLAAITKTRRKITGSDLPQPELLRLTGNLAAGQIGDSAGPFDVFDTERLHERVVGELTGIRDDAVKARNERDAKRDESVRRVVESEAKARAAEARAESAPVNPGPTTCVVPASCPVEATLAKAQEAETEALEARIGVRDLKQGATKDAASTTVTLADKAVKYVRDAETKAAAASAPQPEDSSERTAAATAAAEGSAKEAHLLAEKAKAYAEAAREWATHAGAIAARENALAALKVHRDVVTKRIRDVLNDYAAVIAVLLESRTPSVPGHEEVTDGTQTDGDNNK